MSAERLSIRKSSTNRVEQADKTQTRDAAGAGAPSVLGAFTTTQIAHNLLFGPVRAATTRCPHRSRRAARCPEKLTKDVFGLSATCSPAVLMAGGNRKPPRGWSLWRRRVKDAVDGPNRTEMHEAI